MWTSAPFWGFHDSFGLSRSALSLFLSKGPTQGLSRKMWDAPRFAFSRPYNLLQERCEHPGKSGALCSVGLERARSRFGHTDLGGVGEKCGSGHNAVWTEGTLLGRLQTGVDSRSADHATATQTQECKEREETGAMRNSLLKAEVL